MTSLRAHWCCFYILGNFGCTSNIQYVCNKRDELKVVSIIEQHWTSWVIVWFWYLAHHNPQPFLTLVQWLSSLINNVLIVSMINHYWLPSMIIDDDLSLLIAKSPLLVKTIAYRWTISRKWGMIIKHCQVLLGIIKHDSQQCKMQTDLVTIVNHHQR